MNIVISNRALTWFLDEMGVQSGDTIRFYPRYGGSSPFHQGFSLGMSKDDPLNPSTLLKHDGVTFFIEDDDLWFFNNHDLYVDFDQKLEELSYEYK